MTWFGVLWLVPLPPPRPGTTCHTGPTLWGSLLSGYPRSHVAQQVLSLGLRPKAECPPLPLSATSWKVPMQNIRSQRAKVTF